MAVIGPNALQTFLFDVADKEDIGQLIGRTHAMLRLGDAKRLDLMASAL